MFEIMNSSIIGRAIQNKLIARENMRKDIKAKMEEVTLATEVRNQAQLIFEKNKKYLEESYA